MSSSLSVSNVSFPNGGNFSNFGAGTMMGLPHAMEVHYGPNGNLDIKPIEGGSVGYGIGRTIRVGFDSLYPRVSALFRWVVENLPQPSLFNIRGASAAFIPASDRSAFERKKGGSKEIARQFALTQRCQKTTMGNCSISNVGRVKTVQDFAFVAAGSSGIQVVRTSDPWNPQIVGFFNDTNKWVAWDLAISGDNAFVAFGSGGLQVLSMKDPFSPFVIGFYNKTKDIAKQINVLGNRVVVGCHERYSSSRLSRTLRVFDIQVPSSPKLVGTYTFPQAHAWDGFYDFALSKNFAFLVGQEITVLDISTPNPSNISSYAKSWFDGIVIQANFAYATCNDDQYCTRFQIIDITQVKNASFEGRMVGRPIFSPVVSGNYAYVGVKLWGPTAVYIINITDPMHPEDIDGYQISPTTNIQYFAKFGNNILATAKSGSKAIFQVAEIVCP